MDTKRRGITRMLSSVIVIIVIVAAGLVVYFALPSLTPKKAVAVTAVTPITPDGEISPAYVALKQGYFSQQGLNVTIENGKGSQTDLSLLATGQVDFVIAVDSMTFSTAVTKGLPIQAVMEWEGQLDEAILSYSPIHTWTDLNGMSFCTAPGSSTEDLLKSAMTANGADFSSLKIIDVAISDQVPAFIAGQCQLVGTGVDVRLPVIQDSSPGKTVYKLMYAQTAPLMGGVVAVSSAFAQANPSIVSGFVKALQKGVQYSVKNPTAPAAAVAFYQPSVNQTQIQQAFENAIPLFEVTQFPGGANYGMFNETVTTASIDYISTSLGLTGSVPYSTTFTNQYLTTGIKITS